MCSTGAINNIFKLMRFFKIICAVLLYKLLSHQDFMKWFNSNNEVLLKTGYGVIVIFPSRALHAVFHDGFWKSDHDLLIAFHSNFCAVIHDSRDSEILFQTGFDVIFSPPLEDVFHTCFVDGVWMCDPVSWSLVIIDIFRLSLTVPKFFDILFWLVIAHSYPF